MRIWASLNELTQFAIILISLIAVGFHFRWTRRNTAMGPTFLTTLGIFFCFTGIAWGLLDFDPADIRAGIPHLLEGIRTSFWASVSGIFWALTIKGRVALLGDAALPAGGAQRGATVGDLAEHLVTLQQSVQESNKHLVQLSVSFERHADKMVAANTQALTEALQTVIREFNNQVKTTAGLPLIEQSITELTRQIQRGVQANQESMQSQHQQLTSLLSKTIETANRDLTSHLRRAAEDAGKHVVALDRALEEELTRSIESLGRQLTALSQKFVQDYTPLTVSLQRLLHGVRA